MNEFLKILGGIFGFVLLGVIFYMDGYYPFTKRALFNNLKGEFNKVLQGKVSYLYFASHFRATFLQIAQKDSSETVSLKYEISEMLEYEDFLRRVFADSSISFNKFLSQWREYGLYAGHESESKPEVITIPDCFTNSDGIKIMNRMVEAGYLEPGTYQWKDANSTYLQAIFADAIGQELGVPYRLKWKYFKGLWGDKNYGDLFYKAISSKEYEVLESTVKKVFPKYCIKTRTL